jgi:hypothetical protein
MAAGAPEGDQPCDFSFPNIGEDAYDLAGEGNDSYFSAREIPLTSIYSLTLDTGTPQYYRDNLVYGEYMEDGKSTSSSIHPEQDYDYYYLRNDDQQDITVTVNADTENFSLYVDRKEAAQSNVDPYSKSITVTGKHIHNIMVTGSETASYSIDIKTADGKSAEPLAVDDSMLDVKVGEEKPWVESKIPEQW